MIRITGFLFIWIVVDAMSQNYVKFDVFTQIHPSRSNTKSFQLCCRNSHWIPVYIFATEHLHYSRHF